MVNKGGYIMYSKAELENLSMIELMMKGLMSTINEQTKGESEDVRRVIIDSLVKKFIEDSGVEDSICDLCDMLNSELDEVAEEINKFEDKHASDFSSNINDTVTMNDKIEEECKGEPKPESYSDIGVLGLAVTGVAVGALLGFGLATLFNEY